MLDEPLSRPGAGGDPRARRRPASSTTPTSSPPPSHELEALAGDQVVVAPNPDLPHPIVATAWVFKRTCETVDAAALQEFVDDHVGKGPEG